MQVCLHTTWTVRPGTEDQFLELLQPMRQLAAREPKCQYYNAFTSAEGNGEIRVVEIWDSQSDYLNSVRSKQEFMQMFHQGAEQYSVKPQVLEVWNPAEGFKHVRRG